jgi:selenocysteine lyase/cysteine desulfurase
MAVMYARKSVHERLASLGHFFKTRSTLDELLGLGGASYELAASIPQVCKYLSQIPWKTIASYEEDLQQLLLGYLRSDPEQFQIYGEPSADAAKRVPVISFTVKGWTSKSLVETIEKTHPYGFRFGSFYSNRLVEEVLGLNPDDGIIRVSLVHYNTRGFTRICFSLD